METFKALSERASVREYESKSIDRSIIEKLVDAGRRAPSARAVEPWEFIAVTDGKILEKLGTIANTGSFIKSAACCIVIYCSNTKYYLEDGSAATENILIMAADLGLGACWVAGDKKPYTDAVSKLLGVPTGMKLVSLISVGWPKTKPRQNKHRASKDVLHWEKWEKSK